MTQTLYLDNNENVVETRMIEKHPEDALKTLISQQTMGIVYKDFLHATISSVMKHGDNKLKRLLYYFFETLIEDPSFVMCVNQINKDLSSPNEYVRGFALKLAAKFTNYDHVNLQAVKDNLNYKHYYVRMNGVICLAALANRFDLDVESDLVSMLDTETNSLVQRAIFIAMYSLAINFEEYISDFDRIRSEDVLEFLVEHVNDLEFLKKCAKVESDTVQFKSMCRLLEMNEPISIGRMFEILKKHNEFKADFTRYICFIKQDVVQYLNLLDPYEVDFSLKIIDKSIKLADSVEYTKISQILYEKQLEMGTATEIRKSFKIALLDKIVEMIRNYCVFADGLVAEMFENFECSDPDLVYASLKVLNAIKTDNLIKNDDFNKKLISLLRTIRYGKIFRYCIDTIGINITEEEFRLLLSQTFEDFDDKLVFYLSIESEVFLGGYFCYSICTMLKRILEKDVTNTPELKSKTIALCIKFIEFGKESTLMDQSTHASIITAIRYVLDDTKKAVELQETTSPVKNSACDLFAPLDISLLKKSNKIKKYKYERALDSKTKTIQLSGLGDPLYVECNLIYTKYECILDLLIINQTEFYLPEFNIDFTHSRHLKLVDTLYPTGIQPSTAVTQKVTFNILESSNSFITASLSFRYPKHGDYANKPYTQHLGEIKLDIQELLEEVTDEIDFVGQWKTLEWENIYSLTTPINNMDEILKKLVEKVNGKLVSKESVFNFLVANFVCRTIQKSLVLVNVCMGESNQIEIRVRSKDEAVVKSIANLLGNCIKY
ncbi:COPB [Enterospora canceri]|uniref:COPB n=1 Tax=Enterospora canceri TaxID=1081671 RepID=A0A1Y1S5E5_9MICR|nr:COPB [Enterospora canceri]